MVKKKSEYDEWSDIDVKRESRSIKSDKDYQRELSKFKRRLRTDPVAGIKNIQNNAKKIVSTGLKKYKRSPREKVYEIKARKLINVLSPKGSLVKSLTYGPGVSKGRGRPRKSYKPRYVPGIGFVRVPTSEYNKLMSQVKLKQKLILAQKRAQAEQIAMQTDPRYQPDISDEQFLEEPDIQQQVMYPEQQQIYTQEQPQQQIRPNLIQRFTQAFSNVGRAPMRQYGQVPQRNPFFNPPERPLYGNSGIQPQQQVPIGQVIREPRVTIVSEKSSILSPKERVIGFS
ncbi:MAG: hypothetical protein WC346_17255 [Methanogenium sp.]|jgi:hypothetical protein